MADQPPMGRDFIDAKNVDPIDHNDQTDPEDSASQPRFPGPGSSTTAPSTSKPHSNKLLNKLDPRYDNDVLESEKQEKEKVQRRGWD
ncbi:hypothetical protein BO79DRAFT_223848 [Aspergillus costaricaensis CBS 115574]|uniref:Uncharacterized protein n=1 Tax=Aspergillus costaricaensis CBS 115574 TaxID=1448317 RepID=A0ACD1ISV2_9EURO|nr:hypothetical protein BO79DRAFT_223848 [Aspergillus costaricaensis CBS 115574]RAK93363.1 hypothetical protein BO79DRAFT_223848 [Aspergillus costaricaensis CBS 115574]